jgi:acyl-CoA reductase-like NAD-dependent aldehyde dehydrogenase
VITTLDQDDPQSVSDKVKQARKAQESWRNVPLNEKLSIIERAKSLLREPERQAKLAEILTQEMGKPIVQAFSL